MNHIALSEQYIVCLHSQSEMFHVYIYIISASGCLLRWSSWAWKVNSTLRLGERIWWGILLVKSECLTISSGKLWVFHTHVNIRAFVAVSGDSYHTLLSAKLPTTQHFVQLPARPEKTRHRIRFMQLWRIHLCPNQDRITIWFFSGH